MATSWEYPEHQTFTSSFQWPTRKAPRVKFRSSCLEGYVRACVRIRFAEDGSHDPIGNIVPRVCSSLPDICSASKLRSHRNPFNKKTLHGHAWVSSRTPPKVQIQESTIVDYRPAFTAGLPSVCTQTYRVCYSVSTARVSKVRCEVQAILTAVVETHSHAKTRRRRTKSKSCMVRQIESAVGISATYFIFVALA